LGGHFVFSSHLVLGQKIRFFCGGSIWISIKNFGLLSWKLSELWSFLCFGTHFVFVSWNGINGSRTCLSVGINGSRTCLSVTINGSKTCLLVGMNGSKTCLSVGINGSMILDKLSGRLPLKQLIWQSNEKTTFVDKCKSTILFSSFFCHINRFSCTWPGSLPKIAEPFMPFERQVSEPLMPTERQV